MNIQIRQANLATGRTTATELIVKRLDNLAEHHSPSAPALRREMYQIILFLTGSGHFNLDFTLFEIKSGRTFFVSPGQVCSWRPGPQVTGYLIEFPKLYFDSFLLRPQYLASLSFFQSNPARSVVDFDPGEQQTVYGLAAHMLKLEQSGKGLHPDTIRVLLLELLMMTEQWLQSSMQRQPAGSAHKVIDNFQKLIEAHYIENRLPQTYAKMLFISPNHLNAICKAYMGLQAGEMVRNRVVLEAKRMLITLDATITQIAHALHFKDNSYFTKFFKKYTGQTPEDFRRLAGVI